MPVTADGQPNGGKSLVPISRKLLARHRAVAGAVPLVVFIDWPCGMMDAYSALPVSEKMDLWRMYVPEAYASGVFYAFHLKTANPADPTATESGVMDFMADYILFYDGHRDLYQETVPAPERTVEISAGGIAYTVVEQPGSDRELVHLVNHNYDRGILPQGPFTVTLDSPSPRVRVARLARPGWSGRPAVHPHRRRDHHPGGRARVLRRPRDRLVTAGAKGRGALRSPARPRPGSSAAPGRRTAPARGPPASRAGAAGPPASRGGAGRARPPTTTSAKNGAVNGPPRSRPRRRCRAAPLVVSPTRKSASTTSSSADGEHGPSAPAGGARPRESGRGAGAPRRWRGPRPGRAARAAPSSRGRGRRAWRAGSPCTRRARRRVATVRPGEPAGPAAAEGARRADQPARRAPGAPAGQPLGLRRGEAGQRRRGASPGRRATRIQAPQLMGEVQRNAR